MRPIAGYSLWIGNVGDVWEPPSIHALGIAAVVDLALNERPANLPRDVVYCRFPLIDGGGNASWLLRLAIDTTAALLQGSVPTLIYCSAGMSRSVGIAAAALSKVGPASPVDALQLAAASGPHDVTPSFWADLAAILG